MNLIYFKSTRLYIYIYKFDIMILNTIEWIYNLKFKNMKMTIYYFIKKCEKTFLWIMSTLLENDNNIILWKKWIVSTLLENNNNIILWESMKWLLLWVLDFMT